MYVSQNDVNNAERKLRNATYVRGISEMHSVRPHNGFILMRQTSCYNDCCRYVPTCQDWVKTTVEVVNIDETGEPESDIVCTSTDETDGQSANDQRTMPVARVLHTNGTDQESLTDDVSVSLVGDETTSDKASPVPSIVDKHKQIYWYGTMVKAYYSSKVYVGKILQFDEKNNDYFISFMEKKKRSSVYIWPKDADQIWVKFSNIVNVVNVDESGNVTDASETQSDKSGVRRKSTRTSSKTKKM